jgi:hypothetical protein
MKQQPVVPNGAATPEETAAALEAMRKFQTEAHPRRVRVNVPTWNGKVVPPIS